MKTDRLALRAELEAQLRRLGFEIVQIEWAGHSRRPIIRLRIEHADPALPLTLDDCARASRSLEPWLDRQESLSDHYLLEVSSPGLERPLTRDRDFDRFRGRRVAVQGSSALHGEATRIEGELLGLEAAADGTPTVALRLSAGEELRLPRERITGARLVPDWGRKS